MIKRLVRKRRPYPDESLAGFLLRLTDLNSWEKITWIMDYAGIGRPNAHHTSFTFAFDKNLNLSRLAHISKTKASLLAKTMYPTTDDGNQAFFMDTPVTKYAIAATRAALCPQCLKATPYHRKIWDLALVTCCPLHRCLLIDHCPACRKKITFYRRKIAVCPNTRCQFKFTDAPATAIDPTQTYLTAHIYDFLGGAHIETVINNSPFARLSLDALYKIVAFFASHYCLAQLDPMGRKFAAASIVLRHRAISRIAPVLCQWPEGFYRFIERAGPQRPHKSYRHGLCRDFGKIYTSLADHFFHGEYAFIAKTFEAYLHRRRQGHLITRSQWAGQQRTAPATIGKMEAVNLLKAREATVDRLIARGLLKATLLTSSKRRLVRIDRRSLLAYQKALSHHLPVKAAAKILFISKHLTWGLLNAGLLQTASGPDIDGARYTRVDQRSLKKLVDTLYKRFFRNGGQAGHTDLVCLKGAYVLLRYFKIGYAQIIKRAVAGDIAPCAISSLPGLGAFLFDAEKVQALANGRRK